MNGGTYVLDPGASNFIIYPDYSGSFSVWLRVSPFIAASNQVLNSGTLQFGNFLGSQDGTGYNIGAPVLASQLDGINLNNTTLLDANDNSNEYILTPTGPTVAVNVVPEPTHYAIVLGTAALCLIAFKRRKK